jgi:hypothetical protein
MIRQAGLPKAVNVNQVFTLAEPDMELFETFGKGLKEKIMSSPEWVMHGSKNPKVKSSVEDLDDDLPF